MSGWLLILALLVLGGSLSQPLGIGWAAALAKPA